MLLYAIHFIHFSGLFFFICAICFLFFYYSFIRSQKHNKIIESAWQTPHRALCLYQKIPLSVVRSEKYHVFFFSFSLSWFWYVFDMFSDVTKCVLRIKWGISLYHNTNILFGIRVFWKKNGRPSGKNLMHISYSIRNTDDDTRHTTHICQFQWTLKQHFSLVNR